MITIRTVRDEDGDQIVMLEAELFGTDAWSEDLVRDELTARHRSYFVAVDEDDAVVGYAGLYAVGTEADVQTIAVIPEMRGQGLGAQLLQTLFTRSAQLGVRQLFLEVRADNEAARRLYARFGFEAIGERPGYYQPGNVSAVVMKKTLSPTGSTAVGSEAVVREERS